MASVPTRLLRVLLAASHAWLLAAPGLAGIEVAEVGHHHDASRPAAVHCSGDGTVSIRAGGAVLRRSPGAETFTRDPAGTWPEGLDEARATVAGELVRGTPVRDRLMFSSGLRSRQVRGGWRSGDTVACWYGGAAPGISVREGGAWHDVATLHRVLDADIDMGRRYWAITEQGLVTGALSGGDALSIPLPRFDPGNALDGAFVYDGRLHVFGPRGLHRSEVVTGTTGPVTWTAVLERPVRAAAVIPGGMSAVTGSDLWMFPSRLLYPVPMPGVWALAGTRDRRLYLATACELSSVGPGRPVPVLDALLAAPVRAMHAAGDTLAIALAGPAGGVQVGRAAGTAPGAPLRVHRFELHARCFLERRAGLLVGTNDGLASIEGDRVHWYLRRPGLSVTAIAAVKDRLALATSEGLVVLDGPAIVGRSPLGAGESDARVTALVPHGEDLWAATAGHGLYRLQLRGVEGGVR